MFAQLSIARLVLILLTTSIEPGPPPEIDECIARIYEALGDEHISPVAYGPTGWTTSPLLDIACDWPNPIFLARLKLLAQHANEQVARRAAIALLRYEGIDVDSLTRFDSQTNPRPAAAEMLASARKVRLESSFEGVWTTSGPSIRPGESNMDVPTAMKLLGSADQAASWDAHVFLISRGIVPAGTFIRDVWPHVAESDRIALLQAINKTWFLCGHERLRLQLAAVFARRDTWLMTDETLRELFDALLFLGDRSASTLVQHTLPRLSGGQQPDPGVYVPPDGARLLKLTGGLANSTRNRLNLERATRLLRSPDRHGLHGQGLGFLARSCDPSVRPLVVDWYWNERREQCGRRMGALSYGYTTIEPDCACFYSRMYIVSLEERVQRLPETDEMHFFEMRADAAMELLAVEAMLRRSFVPELEPTWKRDAGITMVALALLDGALERGIARAGQWIRENCCDSD